MLATVACTLLHSTPTTDAAPWCGAESTAAASGWGVSSSPARGRRHDLDYERSVTPEGETCGHCPIDPDNVCDLPDVRDMFAPEFQAADDGWLRLNLTFHMFSNTAGLLPGGITQAHVDAQTAFINSVYKSAKIEFASQVDLHVNAPLGTIRVSTDYLNALAQSVTCGNSDFGAEINDKCLDGYPLDTSTCVCPGSCVGSGCLNTGADMGDINVFNVEGCKDCVCDKGGHVAEVGEPTNPSAHINPVYATVDGFDQVPGVNTYYNLNRFTNRKGDGIKYKFNDLPAGSEVKFVVRKGLDISTRIGVYDDTIVGDISVPVDATPGVWSTMEATLDGDYYLHIKSPPNVSSAPYQISYALFFSKKNCFASIQDVRTAVWKQYGSNAKQGLHSVVVDDEAFIPHYEGGHDGIPDVLQGPVEAGNGVFPFDPVANGWSIFRSKAIKSTFTPEMVAKDEGDLLPIVIAHELGHNLGLFHTHHAWMDHEGERGGTPDQHEFGNCATFSKCQDFNNIDDGFKDYKGDFCSDTLVQSTETTAIGPGDCITPDASNPEVGNSKCLNGRFTTTLTLTQPVQACECGGVCKGPKCYAGQFKGRNIQKFYIRYDGQEQVECTSCSCEKIIPFVDQMKARQDEGKCFQGVDIKMDTEPVVSRMCNGPTKAGVLGQNIMSYWFSPSSAQITKQQGDRARCWILNGKTRIAAGTQQTTITASSFRDPCKGGFADRVNTSVQVYAVPCPLGYSHQQGHLRCEKTTEGGEHDGEKGEHAGEHAGEEGEASSDEHSSSIKIIIPILVVVIVTGSVLIYTRLIQKDQSPTVSNPVFENPVAAAAFESAMPAPDGSEA